MTPGFWGNLARRIATAAVAIPLLLGTFFLGPPGLGVAVVALAVAYGFVEYLRLLPRRGLRPFHAAGFLILAEAFLDVVRPGGMQVSLWPLVPLVLLGAVLTRGAEFATTVPDAGATLLGAAYLGGLGGSVAALRVVEPASDGAWRIVLLLATLMASDTAAFFSGHLFGRRRLAPSLSPGKTVEGAVGGLVGGAIAAVIVRALGLPRLPLSHAIGLGLVVSAMGIVGDLAESLLKRWAGVKDSGSLFPGHGGMLDRLDSLLFGAPVLYYYFLSIR